VKLNMILTYLTWLYAALMAIYIVWTTFGLPRPWWLKAFDTVSFWFFAPSFLLLLLAIPISRVGYRLAATLAALLFMGHFWLPFLPWGSLKRWIYPQARRGAGGVPLRVMTTNLLKNNGDGHLVAATIASEDADVVALQELRSEHVRALQEQLGATYPYRQLYPGDASEGLGLLSRIPLESHELRPGRPGGNPTQIVRLVVGNRGTWLVNVHSRIPELRLKPVAGILLPYDMDTEGRTTDIRELVQMVEERTGNVLILGDLNTTEHCQEYRLLPERWHDTYREIGWGPGWTFPVGARFFGVRLPFPIFRIDYVFHRGAWQPQSVRNGTMPGSDHHYLVAEFD
jgi:vancomycin resistance protein VanJ